MFPNFRLPPTNSYTIRITTKLKLMGTIIFTVLRLSPFITLYVYPWLHFPIYFHFFLQLISSSNMCVHDNIDRAQTMFCQHAYTLSCECYDCQFFCLMNCSLLKNNIGFISRRYKGQVKPIIFFINIHYFAGNI